MTARNYAKSYKDYAMKIAFFKFYAFLYEYYAFNVFFYRFVIVIFIHLKNIIHKNA